MSHQRSEKDFAPRQRVAQKNGARVPAQSEGLFMPQARCLHFRGIVGFRVSGDNEGAIK